MTELDKRYDAALRRFHDSVAAATAVSQAAEGREAKSKAWWSSVLFTRLCGNAVSLLLASPRNRYVRSAIYHWDFGAVATLARNLIDCYQVFFYLCIEDVGEQEWRCRLTGFHLHDCSERLRMFQAFDSEDVQLSNFEDQAEELRERLRANEYFLSLPGKKQKAMLRGGSQFLFTRTELAERMEIDTRHFRGMYRFLSAQVHTLPMSFYRMGEQERGRGIESDVEKGYMAETLKYVTPYVVWGTRAMFAHFPDTENVLKPSLRHLVLSEGSDKSSETAT